MTVGRLGEKHMYISLPLCMHMCSFNCRIPIEIYFCSDEITTITNNNDDIDNNIINEFINNNNVLKLFFRLTQCLLCKLVDF